VPATVGPRSRRRYIKGEPEQYLRAHYDRSSEEYRRFHRAKMTATMNAIYADPRRKAEWVMSRHSYPGLRPNARSFGVLGASFGVLGAGAGIDASRAKGGRKPKATPEQQQAMLRLAARSLTKVVL
jgi:hypothetical protein